MKLTQLKTNQFKIETETEFIFQSYQTIVCKIQKKDNSVKITDGQPQSVTTAKYLNQFLSETIGINNYKKLK